MSYEAELTRQQKAAIKKLAQDLLILGAEDRRVAILTMVDGYTKKLRAEYPDLPEEELEAAVFRFGDLILQRFNELNTSIGSGEGHA